MLEMLVVVCCLTASHHAAVANDKPNIVLVMADDQGWGDMAYNGHPRLKSRHFDDVRYLPHIAADSRRQATEATATSGWRSFCSHGSEAERVAAMRLALEVWQQSVMLSLNGEDY